MLKFLRIELEDFYPLVNLHERTGLGPNNEDLIIFNWITISGKFDIINWLKIPSFGK